jgi:2-methylcitrate dehydratase PrpD
MPPASTGICDGQTKSVAVTVVEVVCTRVEIALVVAIGLRVDSYGTTIVVNTVTAVAGVVVLSTLVMSIVETTVVVVVNNVSFSVVVRRSRAEEQAAEIMLGITPAKDTGVKAALRALSCGIWPLLRSGGTLY